jgi:hypothetical protein
MAGLRISKDLELPIDAVTQAIAILARKGMGKTYTASVIVEEVVKAKVPVVVVDPTGAYFGLRSSADGERAGLPVVIFGGDHGDVPLEPTAGKVIADVILEHPGAYVVDLSAFESRASEIRFAAEFFDRLYRGKKRETGPLLLVVDEADIFAPQRPGPEQTKTLGALEAIVRRGRIKGLGDLLITQRAAVLNKNCLTQTEILIVGQTTGPQDRAAIDDWIAGNGTREERDLVIGSLASLERGEVWVWSPSFLRILDRIRIRRRTTYDSSRTPEAGETALVPRAFAKVDLEQLGARIAATVEQAKANDPAELRRRISQLEAAQARPAAPAPERVVETVEKIIEVPVLNGQVGDLREAITRLAAITPTLAHAASALSETVGRVDLVGTSILEAIDRVLAAPRPAPVIPAAHSAGREPDRERTAAPPAQRVDPVSRPVIAVSPRLPAEPGSLGKAERQILGALASYPAPLERAQLSFLAGYHPRSKGFVNALGTLRSAGLISAGFPATRTPEGAAATSDVLPAGDLVETWLARMGRAERAILAALIAEYPASLERDVLAQGAGFEHIRSKGFVNALGRLRGLGLVEGLALSPGFAVLVGR